VFGVVGFEDGGVLWFGVVIVGVGWRWFFGVCAGGFFYGGVEGRVGWFLCWWLLGFVGGTLV